MAGARCVSVPFDEGAEFRCRDLASLLRLRDGSSITILGVASCIGAVVVIHCLAAVLKHGEMRPWRRWPTLVGVEGTVLMAFFISVVAVVLMPFQCSDHPSHLRIVRAYQSVICWETDSHSLMLQTAAVAMVVPISFFTMCVYVVHQLPSRLQKADLNFLHAFSFLFFRFRAEAHWFSMVYLCRNLVISLAPVLPSPLSQICTVQAVLLFSLVLMSHVFPWRIPSAHYLDIVVNIGVLMTASMASFFVNDSDFSSAANVVVVMVGVIFAAIAVCLTYGVAQKFMALGRKKFSRFICHHKMGTGALARLLKMLLVKSGRLRGDVFVDSDDLTNLYELFDIVASQTSALVVLCSRDLLRRPYCVGEITTAVSTNISMITVLFPQYVMPDDFFCDRFSSYVTNISCLTRAGISMGSVRQALLLLSTYPSVDLPEILGQSELDGLVKALEVDVNHADGQQSHSLVACSGAAGLGVHGGSTNSSVGPRVLLVADVANSEACAAARILCLLMAPHAAHDPRSLPHMLIDYGRPPMPGVTTLPETTQEVVFVCTAGCFHSPGFLLTLFDCARLQAAAFPVMADDVFVPTPDIYATIRATGEQCIEILPDHVKVRPGATQLAHLAEHLFQTIAVMLRPHGSLRLLEAQALEICSRVLEGENRGKRVLPRPTVVAGNPSDPETDNLRRVALVVEDPKKSSPEDADMKGQQADMEKMQVERALLQSQMDREQAQIEAAQRCFDSTAGVFVMSSL